MYVYTVRTLHVCTCVHSAYLACVYMCTQCVPYMCVHVYTVRTLHVRTCAMWSHTACMYVCMYVCTVLVQ